VVASFVLRLADATKEALIPVPAHTTNGDETLYADKSGTYTKVLLQDSFGKVDLNAYNSMKNAFATGNPSDFENIILGGTRTLNGPQGSLAFGLQGTDAVQFGNATSPANQENSLAIVPPPPAVASAAYGTELVEMHWASLLRDVAFTDYPTNATAIAAAAELNTMPSYAGPKVNGVVTPDVLFRGGYPGNTIGPYISQLFITPTALGAQTMNQQLTSYVAGVDFMADLATWFQAQNGIDTGLRNQVDPTPRYGYDGRVLAAYTHVDVLYQAYFTAFLVLSSIGAPLNPGNPYVHSRTQNGFSTFGGPAIAAALGEIAARALDVVWYQKWLVHLRHRPESGGIGPPDVDQSEQHQRNAEQQCSEFASGAVQLQQVRFVLALADFSGRFAGASGVSHGTRHGGRGVHDAAEVLFRRQLCNSESTGADQRRPGPRALHRFGRGADYGGRGIEQARTQCKFRPRDSCGDSLAQRHGFVDSVGRGAGNQLPSGPGGALQRKVHGHVHQAGWDDGDDLTLTLLFGGMARWAVPLFF